MADRCAVEGELDATASGECKWSAGELRGGCCDAVERLGGEEGARATRILVAAGGTVPAMEVDGGHGERVGLVQGVTGSERGRRGSRGRPGAALYGEATAHRGRGLRAPAEMAEVAVGGGSGLSAALVGVAQVEGEGERERGSGRAPRVWARPLGLSGGSGARAAGGEKRERRGGQHGGVMRTSRHLDWREGEARGGRVAWAESSYSAWEHCSVLWSTSLACHGIKRGKWARPLVSSSARE